MSRCLDRSESLYLQEAVAFLQSADPASARRLAEGISRLEELWEVCQTFPSLLLKGSQGPLHHAGEGLVEALCHAQEEMGALAVPVRAVMGEVFLIAKIQLLRDFRYTLLGLPEPAPPSLLAKAAAEVSQSIYTRILDEILTTLTLDEATPMPVRQRAAAEVVRLWDCPAELEIDDFYPVLEQVWRARERVDVIYGALTGSTEFYQLLKRECPDLFMTHFLRDDATPQENAAFREFLFGLPWEELTRVEAARGDQGVRVVDRDFVETVIGRSLLPPQAGAEPEALYASFRRRKRAAAFRRSGAQPGPHRTAEAYLTLHLLSNPTIQERLLAERPPSSPVDAAHAEIVTSARERSEI